MRRRSRARRIPGVVPRLAAGLGSAWRWLGRHPRPFLLLGAVALLIAGLLSYARRADAFRIARVQLPERPSFQVRRPLIGANIWSVDLGGFAEELHAQHPWLRAVRVVRELPDTLRVQAVPRLPVAQVHRERWYAVDRDGFVLPEGRDEAAERLVRLSGFSPGTLQPGKPIGDERIRLALHLLELLKQEPALAARRVTDINVSDLQQLRFTIEGDTEVRCGREADLAANLRRLRGAFRAIGRHPFDVGYIDVRFQDPVVGPKT